MVDLDWDAWRVNYDQMTFADQQAFYEQVAELYPHQESANVAVAHEAFDQMPYEHKVVVELGGWNGRLAAQMFGRGDVTFWTNYDLVRVPQACSAIGYRMAVLNDWIWNRPPHGADVFVACHTIEHLKAPHLTALINWVARSEIPWVYFEAPIGNEALHDWTGYAGTHILELGWPDVDCLFARVGYERVTLSTASAYLWRRG